MENKNKMIYRVETAERILSSHKTMAGASKSQDKHNDIAAKGFCGLTPETLIFVTAKGKRVSL